VARYVTRGGEKLEFALNEFEVPTVGIVAADLGSHAGGFVDCLLRRGAATVYSVDTSYGTLSWRLRCDERVVVLERTNALHVELPEKVELVTIDVGWTPQRLILPKALGLVRPGGLVLSLLKPQYEAQREEVKGGVLPPERARDVAGRVVDRLADQGIHVAGCVESPLVGGKGNIEFFLKLSVPQGGGPG
jgi:23S rRNA (cytidine1920-2'-O)/16S rRNA (cytidine1409-2'-O)-methyltransferase